MGTRNLTCVVLNSDYKIAQYCQWDGYPSGQGFTALEFLTNDYKPELFKEKLQATKWLSQAEIKKLWREAGAPENSDGWVTMDVSDKFKENNYHLSRDCGAEILKIVQESPAGLGLVNTVSFAADSVFCEWAYVIDLDKNTFEVYTGSNEPITPEDRFYFLVEQAKIQNPEDDCPPVKMIKSYSLDILPTKEQFVQDLTPSDDENED